LKDAEQVTRELIESTLGHSTAYKQIDKRLYVLKQGSTYVMINIVPSGGGRILVRCVAQLVRGADMTRDQAKHLLTINTYLRFGAFAYEPKNRLVLFIHTILGGNTLDPEELLATVTDMAVLADSYDDKIVARFGGQRMQDLLEDAALKRIVEFDDDAFEFAS
jgi:hypothetical protein